MSTTLFGVSATRPATTTFTSAVTKYLAQARTTQSAVSQTDSTVASLVTAANPQGSGAVAFVGNAASHTLAAAGTVEASATIGAAIFWVSDPLTVAATIAGTITANLRGKETSNANNYGIGCKIYKVSGNAVTAAIAQGASTSELGTTDAARSVALTPTSTVYAAGDQIGIVLFFCSAGGTSSSGSSALASYNGPATATGDLFFTFTENLVFSTVGPPTLLDQAVKRGAFFMSRWQGWQRRRSGLVAPKPGILVPA